MKIVFSCKKCVICDICTSDKKRQKLELNYTCRNVFERVTIVSDYIENLFFSQFFVSSSWGKRQKVAREKIARSAP